VVERFPKFRAALTYAERQHEGQLGRDGAPWTSHLVEVASLLHEAGAADYVVVAGVLHDTIEKTSTTAFDLRRRFGSRIASLVLAVSEDQRIEAYAERKAALCERMRNESDDAVMVFAADKISKVRELGRERSAGCSPRRPTASTKAPRRQRLAHYRHCLRLLDERLPGSPLVSQLRTELMSVTRPGRALAPAR
jgi:(p)ppGpp synthase/HD superfamily hydrolase